MKKIIIGILILSLLALAGCSTNRDAEVKAFIVDVDKVTTDLIGKINAKPTAAGIDEAQKILDGKKSDLKARYDQLKTLRGFELSDQVMKEFTDSVGKNMESVADLQIKNAEKTVADEAFGQKMNKLYTDYNAIFGV